MSNANPARVTFELFRTHAQTCLSFASTIADRSNLKGVHVEMHEDRILLMATDGHKLVLARQAIAESGAVEGIGASFMLPIDGLRPAVALATKANAATIAVEVNLTAGTMQCIVASVGATFGATIDRSARAPNWRRVFPAEPVPGADLSAIYDATIVQSIIAALRVYSGNGKRSGGFQIEQSPSGRNSPAIFTTSATCDVVALLMPMRPGNSREAVLAWIKSETQAPTPEEGGEE